MMSSSAYDDTSWRQLSISSFQRREPCGTTRRKPALRNRRCPGVPLRMTNQALTPWRRRRRKRNSSSALSSASSMRSISTHASAKRRLAHWLRAARRIARPLSPGVGLVCSGSGDAAASSGTKRSRISHSRRW